MELTAVLRDLAVVLAIATVVALVFSRLRLPVVAAFLVAGAILGPTGAGLVSEIGMVESLAEIGVVLLLFTVGLEISLADLGRMRREVLWAGGAQVSATILFTLLVLVLWGLPVPEGLFIGFVVSLSSTAIVLKVLTDRMEIDTSHGRIAVGILIFQDMAVIAMMLLIPSLRQWETAKSTEVLLTLAKAGMGVGALLVLARVLIPRLLKEVIRLNSRDILGLTVLMVVMGTAFLANRWGLSLGLGAFLAGLVISESDYVHEIAAQIMPFRDVFTGVFFISVGMLLDLPFLARNLLLILPMVAAVALLKTFSAGAAIRALVHPWRLVVIVSVSLMQIGEFSFLLMSEGYRIGLIGPIQYQSLLAIAILTMVATPFVMNAGPGIATRWEQWVTGASSFPETGEEQGLRRNGRENHVIIAGFGMNGKNLARVLKATRVPYVVVDINDAQVREGRASGEPMFYGDVNRPEILDRAGVGQARILVLAISDPMATRRAVAIARRSNPALFILVRTRYAADVDDLVALGANAVIPEEFETSVEIFSRVLAEYHVPDHVIRQQEQIIRSGTYRILRDRGPVRSEEVLAGFEEFLRRNVIEVFYVAPSSGWGGRSVGDLPVGNDTGIVLLAILRKDRAIIQPGLGEPLAAGDKLVLFGGHAPLADALSVLSRPAGQG
ncbi:MAG: Kef-type K+ transport system NAD-binding protein, monovalent cation:H+ antiporter-2, CPA2 family [Deltaproteobacteria bacterium CSP1-8]|nr:MAG: Kef-type K+ transport system NAD-binding protein, monovalent cation:H+ antiporter-2, CPA2 family [Deltaproteobacteria bacterium CSP1-8]